MVQFISKDKYRYSTHITIGTGKGLGYSTFLKKKGVRRVHIEKQLMVQTGTVQKKDG